MLATALDDRSKVLHTTHQNYTTDQ